MIDQIEHHCSINYYNNKVTTNSVIVICDGITNIFTKINNVYC